MSVNLSSAIADLLAHASRQTGETPAAPALLLQSDDPGVSSAADKLGNMLQQLPGCFDAWDELGIDDIKKRVDETDERDLRKTEALCYISMLERSLPMAGGPFDIPTYAHPYEHSCTPCFLSDLQHAHLQNEVSDLLEVNYLSGVDIPDSIPWPAEGVLFGSYKRPMVWLPVAIKRFKPRCVIFLVDTGAPRVELCPQVFEAFGLENTPKATTATINGINCEVHLTSKEGNHYDINVLGANYLSKLRASLVVDYAGDTCNFKPQSL